MKSGAVTVMQVYAPNSADTDEKVDEFYDQLQMAINSTDKKDMMIIMGDFNAKVGSNRTHWESVIGNHGYGTINDRGEKLLNFCAVNNM